jgi:hypothetical protein
LVLYAQVDRAPVRRLLAAPTRPRVTSTRRAWRSASSAALPARCQQCGFASTMGGNPVTEADERAKLRLCVEAAQKIWG